MSAVAGDAGYDGTYAEESASCCGPSAEQPRPTPRRNNDRRASNGVYFQGRREEFQVGTWSKEAEQTRSLLMVTGAGSSERTFILKPGF